MNLNNFDSCIDKKILTRGIDYYKNNQVISIEETDDNLYEAEVEGSDLYLVEVELDDQDNIVDTQCDCPYDLGEYCKHQAAVFYALRDIKNNSSHGNSLFCTDSPDEETLHKSAIPKRRKAPYIEKILTERTKEELVEFLLTIASEYEEIKQRIELNFTDENDEDEISRSITLMRTFIEKKSDRHGFVAYGDTFEAVKGADLVLEKARSALEKNKTMHALELVLCVAHEMINLLQYADDSDGAIGCIVEESFHFIDEIVEDEELSPIDKENIFNKLLKEASDRRYKDWNDWRLELLGSCAVLAGTPVLRDKLKSHMASMVKNENKDSWSSNYFAERINLIRYHMIKKHDGPKEAQEFIGQNLQYPEFREMAIESAMRKKDYESVIKLTLDGEEQDKDMRGLVNRWKEYRYKAFQLSGRLEEQRAIAMDFILDGSIKYYTELKQTYDASEWPAVYPRIISLLENRKTTNQNIYTTILIEEGEKQKLLEYVQTRPSMVESFYKQLVPEYKKEVYTLFVQYIEQAAARAGNRKDYQRVCVIIRNMKKAGGKEQALAIKNKLYNQYAKRPAFRDELSRV